LEGEDGMDQMFTIPANTLLVIGVTIVLAVVGFVIYGFVKGWDKVMPEYHKKHDDVIPDIKG
jgi:hypothetical protein